MAQFTKDQKNWVDQFLDKSGGNGATGTKSPGTPGSKDWDPGTVQALGPGDLVGPAKEVGEAAWNWVNAQGVTKIVIENYSSKVLEFTDKEELLHPKDTKWDRKPPLQIPAAKDGKPGSDFITIKTDKLIRGKTRADTSGWVLYEIVGETEKKTVKIAWLRKGDGTIDNGGYWTESGKYTVKGFQSAEGEFTFQFREVTKATPETPKDNKSKDSESSDGKSKDTKSPPPADTYVLFKQGKSELTSEAKSALHDFARAYLKSKSDATISLDG